MEGRESTEVFLNKFKILSCSTIFDQKYYKTSHKSFLDSEASLPGIGQKVDYNPR